MKLIRDCGILEDEEHEADYNNFLKINEFSERAQDQKFYMQILEEINIKEHLVRFSNKCISGQSYLEEITAELDDLGINNEVVEDEMRLFEIMQEQAKARELRGSKKGNNPEEGRKRDFKPRIGYVEMQMNKEH